MEAVVALLAAAVLFSMSFWMISKVESRRWMAYLRKRLEQTLTRRNVAALALVSFLAVYREAAETVLFTQALLLDSRARGRQVWLGAAAGLLAVVVVAVADEPDRGAAAPGLVLRASPARCSASWPSRSRGPGIYALVARATCRRGRCASPRCRGWGSIPTSPRSPCSSRSCS